MNLAESEIDTPTHKVTLGLVKKNVITINQHIGIWRLGSGASYYHITLFSLAWWYPEATVVLQALVLVANMDIKNAGWG